MKWKSVLFSELSNKLGNQIVAAKWKGRGYFRKYFIPANPKSNKQMGYRETMRALVLRWQAVMAGDPDVVAEWNVEGLDFLISGFNVYTKWAMLSRIACPATQTAGNPIQITYTCGCPINKAGCIQQKATAWTILKDKGELEEGENKTFMTGNLTAGTYIFYLADLDVLKNGDSSPQPYQGFTCWKPDTTNGTVIQAKCVVT